VHYIISYRSTYCVSQRLGLSVMQDTLLQVAEYPTSQSIRMETPIGSIEVDESPMIDVLFLVLMFSAFCIYVYAKYFKKNHE